MALCRNLTPSSYSRSAPLPDRPRPLLIPSPCPGARRACLAPRGPPLSLSSVSGSATGGIRLYSGVPSLRRPSAACSHSPPLEGKSGGGGGGGGSGGAGEGDEAGSGDGEDASNKELQALPLLKRKLGEVIPWGQVAWPLVESIITELAANAATVLSKNPIIRFLLQLDVAPFTGANVLWGSAVFIMDKQSDTSFSSLTSTVVNNPFSEDESSNCSESNVCETTPGSLEMGTVRRDVNQTAETTVNVHDHIDTSNRDTTIAAPLLSNDTPTNSSDLNKKGFLGFLYTLVSILFTLYSGLVTFAVTYPSSAKALVSFDQAWTKGICAVNLISWFGSTVMFPFASRFKDGESTDARDGFGIFIWALYLLLLVLIPAYFTTVQVYLHIPKWIVWCIGTAVFMFTVLPTVLYIEGQRATLVSSVKYMWKKIRSCLGLTP